MAERLNHCGLNTVQDLLFHLPFRYQDRTRITPLARVRLGDQVVIEAVIEGTEITRGQRPSLLCHLTDGTGHLTLRFFHFSPRQQQSLKKGARLRCFGEIRGWGEYEMIHPEYEYVNPSTPPLQHDSLTPVYPTTEGLSQKVLRLVTDQALALLTEDAALPDYLPATIMHDLGLPDLITALRYVHRPPPNADVVQLMAGTHPAQQRLSFEELMAHHLSLRQLRQNVQTLPAPLFAESGRYSNALLTTLPFKLTSAQQRVCAEIIADLKQGKPMLRLLQGDVGSGKTIVAALAGLRAVENKYQAVLMAPTELLAEQHFQNFSKWLAPLDLTVVWLTGKLKSSVRESTLNQIASGAAHIVVGTHALFQEDVKFAALGLVMIDEQHRFGVHQRLALRQKGIRDGFYPHQLIMTATPIPRTLAMIAYADLDVSIIDELPPGRTPVQTVVIANTRREEVIARVQQVCREGRQVYWVCALIEESEALQCQAAETTAQHLQESLGELRVGLIHGRLSAAQKEEVMLAFKKGELDLLVATTVIEVGVDVPNASLMVIENAERLGLAQLHQLRGRVGRGSITSFCVLLYQPDRMSNLAKSRLTVLRETNDGFIIARKDLEIRGPGEVLGTRQAGLLQLKVADLSRDSQLLPQIQTVAETLAREHPEHVASLIRRWVAQKEKYAEV